ncbi:MAG: hypothetical protein H7X89_05095 [Rhizobiales bacterium]|nr:hypothetical protein [Hyphomicrobiales bacterium]
MLWLMVVVGLSIGWWVESREHQKALVRFEVREQDRIRNMLAHELERKTGKSVTVGFDQKRSMPTISYQKAAP